MFIKRLNGKCQIKMITIDNDIVNSSFIKK